MAFDRWWQRIFICRCVAIVIYGAKILQLLTIIIRFFRRLLLSIRILDGTWILWFTNSWQALSRWNSLTCRWHAVHLFQSTLSNLWSIILSSILLLHLIVLSCLHLVNILLIQLRAILILEQIIMSLRCASSMVWQWRPVVTTVTWKFFLTVVMLI